MPPNSPSSRSHLLTLQILTPLSFSFLLVIFLVLSLVPPESLGWVNYHYLTIFTPSNSFISIYWLILAVPSLLYCVFLAFSKLPTDYVHTPSFGLPTLWLLYTVWAIFTETRLFVFAGVDVVIMLMISAWSFLKFEWLGWGGNGWKVWIGSRLAVKLLFLLLLNIHLPQSLLLSFKWYTYVPPSSSATISYLSEPAPDYPSHDSPGPKNPETREWIFFAVITAIGFVDAGIVFAGKDFFWMAGTVYLWMGVLMGKGERPAQVLIPLILLSILLVVCFVTSLFWDRLQRPSREGRIRLEEDGNTDDDGDHRRRPRFNWTQARDRAGGEQARIQGEPHAEEPSREVDAL